MFVLWWNPPGHVQKGWILHHKPTARPAEADLMVTNAVEPLDAVTPRPFQNITFTVGKKLTMTKNRAAKIHTGYNGILLKLLEKKHTQSVLTGLWVQGLWWRTVGWLPGSPTEHNTHTLISKHKTTILCNFVQYLSNLNTLWGQIRLQNLAKLKINYFWRHPGNSLIITDWLIIQYVIQ